MLRLSSDMVYVAVYPDSVALARVSGIARRRVVAQKVVQLPPGGATENLDGLLEVLEPLLEDGNWADARVRVLVSNSLVRYALVPPSREVVGIADELALARLRLQQAHGAIGDSLEIRLSSPLSGAGQIAAAIDRGFLDALLDRVRRTGLRVASVQPFLMYAFERVRNTVHDSQFWFANAENGLLVLASRQDGNWDSLSVAPLRDSLERELQRRVREARLVCASGQTPRALYLYSSKRCAANVGDEGGFSVVQSVPPAGSNALALQHILGI